MKLVEELLSFWFGDLKEGIADPTIAERWFTASTEFDSVCRDRFGRALEDLDIAAWPDDPRSKLALIILCDQIPRNIYRGTARAFAYDDIALDTAKQAISSNLDLSLALEERGFFYLPFEHSESILDQHTAVGLFSKLRDGAPKDLKSYAGNKLRYAQSHRDIVLKFGRFPHRNRVLGRESTQAELEFIRQGDGFGQG